MRATAAHIGLQGSVYRRVCVCAFAHSWVRAYLDATGSCVLSGVCVATPVLPSGRRCPCPAGRADLGQRIGQIG